FNPLLRRAVQEEKITNEQLSKLAESPTLENAREVLTKFNFDQPPLIAEFFLEEVRSTSLRDRRSVTVQVTGRLYELDGPARNNILLTSDPITGGRTAYDQVLLASNNAFGQIVEQFVQPVTDYPLPEEAPVAEVVPEPEPVLVPGPATSPAPNLTGRPGGTLPPGTMPQLPPAEPPLGVAVPGETGGA